MLDINLLRENPRLVKDSEKRRNKDPKVVDEVLSLDEKWKKSLKKMEELKRKRNLVSLEINELKKAGNSGKEKIKEMRSVVEQIKKQEEKVSNNLNKRNELLSSLGNVLHTTVPVGKDDSDNLEIKTWGKKPNFSFKIKNHVEKS